MADFNFSDVASKTQAPQGMSLADIMNFARSSQAYQQAQQVNPLALRQQQAETEFAEQQKPQLLRQSAAATKLAEGTVDPKIAQALSESQTAQSQAGSAKLKLSGEKLSRLLDISSARASDPEILGLTKLAKSPDEKIAQSAKKRLHQLNAEDFETAVKAGLDPSESLEHFGHITAKIDNNPEQLPNIYQNFTRIGTGAQGLLTQQAPNITTNAQGQLIKVNPLSATATTLQGANPSSIFELNGVKYQIDANGNPVPVGQANPEEKKIPTKDDMLANIKGTVGMAGPLPKGITPQQMSQPKSRFEPLVHDLMTIPTSGITQLNKQQQSAYDAGVSHHAQVIDKATLAQDAKQTTNLIRQNIEATAGSKPEQVLRGAGKWLAGNEQLDKLIKNLAQNSIQQGAIMGVDNVHGQQMNQLANGSENITAGALQSIIDRTDATSTAFEKYSTAYDKYIKNKGDINGHANTLAFKEAWKNNYDPRIFMIQNVNSSNLTPKAKKEKVNEILSGISPSDHAKLEEKMFNMKRLEKGDF